MPKPTESLEQQTTRQNRGFTVVEVIVVVVILTIVALMALPMFGSAADIQLKAAANMIAADLEYAKSMAISRQMNYSVVFDSQADSYRVCDSNGDAIAHPLNPGIDLVVVFPSNSPLNKVDIVSADFDGSPDETVTFDYIGSPYSGSTTASPLLSGTISLRAEGFTMTVTVEPITGYVTIN